MTSLSRKPESEYRLEYGVSAEEDAPPAYEEHETQVQSSSASNFISPSVPISTLPLSTSALAPVPSPPQSSYASAYTTTTNPCSDVYLEKSALPYDPSSKPPLIHSLSTPQIQAKGWQPAGPSQPFSFESPPLPPRPSPPVVSVPHVSISNPELPANRPCPFEQGKEIVLNRAGFLRGLSSSSTSDILNPPPPSFSRVPQPQFAYPPFPPCTSISLGKDLADGFPSIPPSSTTQPHPFMTHDVNEEDWLRLLGDIKKVGSSTPLNNVAASGGPLGVGIGLMGGHCI